MAKAKRGLAKKNKKEITELDNVELVYVIRSRGRVKKQKVDDAFDELKNRLKSRIMQIVTQFFIPGFSPDDIHQEALYALRFKAIPDYDKEKIGIGPNPFDKFAVLCIRRHLSTVLKQSWQVKRKALNTSISLDQDRNKYSNEELCLSDILSETEGTILTYLEDKEYYGSLFSMLYEKLSKFEKLVFKLYVQKYSYEEMSDIINKSKRKKVSINVKSIDNALSRIKQKGIEVFRKYGEGKLRR
jgi:RNA polymerase sporulation-specific sigma factor